MAVEEKGTNSPAIWTRERTSVGSQCHMLPMSEGERRANQDLYHEHRMELVFWFFGGELKPNDREAMAKGRSWAPY